MDSKYLLDIEMLLGSTAKIKLLKVLYKYKNIEQSISWLAKQAKISVNQAKLIIDCYNGLGIINYRNVGNTVFVNLKKDTVWLELISFIIEKQENVREELIETLKEQIKNEKINAEVWLFGSFARNEPKQNSDIDVLFLFENKSSIEKNKENLNHIQEKISLKYQKVFSFLVLTEEEFNNDNKQLKNNILREGEKIYG